jgi:hypothetical protein
VLATAGCGGRAAAPPPTPERLWRANLASVVRQLRVDTSSAALGGTTRADAARALADTSDLYALLTAYSDLGGCRAMVAATEAPLRATAPFEAACGHLQRASKLFARAATHDDPAALVRATAEVRRAQPQLVRAALTLK